MTIKRPLMYIAGGFVLGEVLALLPVVIKIGFPALLVCGVLWCCVSKKSSRKPTVWLLLLFCCICGLVRMQAELEEKPWEAYVAATRGRSVEVRGDVRDIAEKEKSVALTLENCIMIRKEVEYQMPEMIVYVEKTASPGGGEPGKPAQGGGAEELRIGMRVSVSGKPERPGEARNPGEFDFRNYYRAQGIRYQMFVRKVSVIDGSYQHYREGIRQLKLAGTRLLDRLCEPQDAGVFRAALLGDKSALEDQVQELYQRNGIAHLLAISGLHISLVGLVLYRGLRKVGLGYGMAGIFGTAVIVSYGVLTGASSSVVRAVLMVLVYMLAEYLGRSYDMLTAAALACILLLAESPYQLFQAGFQLSFGAVGAIGGLGPWLVNTLGIKGNGIKQSAGKALVLGLAIQLVTYPFLLYHFFQYPLYGIFLNLLVIPLMQYVILSGIAAMACGAVYEWLGIMMLGSGHYILQFYIWICSRVDKLPFSNLITGRPELWQIVIFYAALLGIIWGLGWMAKREGHGKCLLLLGGSLVCFFILWRIPDRGVTVTFLDVGQGDGICIRTRESVILVDGGSSSNKELGKYSLEPYLKSQGIRRIDYAVVSHGDTDHVSGLKYLLERKDGIAIRHLLLPWLGQGHEAYEELARLMEEHGGQVYWMKEGDSIAAGELRLTCIYGGDEKNREDINAHSSMMQLEYGEFGLLLTGDLDSEGERAWLANMSEGTLTDWKPKTYQALKVGHHGSRFSTCEEFLQKIDPDYAVISYEEGNSYGHPHAEVIERLNAKKTRIWQTAKSGAVTFKTDGTSIWVEEMIDSEGQKTYNEY